MMKVYMCMVRSEANRVIMKEKRNGRERGRTRERESLFVSVYVCACVLL